MTKMLKKTGAPGTCCECSEQPSACECASNGCVLECQSKTAIAELCGFAEFGDTPSVPPKKYRKCTFSGAEHGDVYDSLDCSHATGAFFDIVLSGAAELSATTCALLTMGTQSTSTDGNAPVVINLTDPLDLCSAAAHPCADTVSVNPTSCALSATGACCPSSSDTAQIHPTDTRTQTLSEEDTEIDAINRASAALPWTASDCAASPAFWTQRGAGDFTFAFRSVQVRGRAGHTPQPALIVGHDYEITIGYYRRVLGSAGPFLFLATDVVSLHASHTEEVTDWQDVPNEAGWETAALTCAIADVTRF